MSEYTQVDLQIGTEAQFETKKATLPEGVLVGLTDPIHENELDSALQTKLNGKASTSYVQGNPTESGTVDLTKLKVGNTVYNVPQGGGGGVTSVTTSGSGNAVTGASISGSQLTLTKGSTFLTAHQSLDSCAKLSAANTFTGTNTFEKIVTIKGAGLKIESSQGSTTYNQGNIMYRPSTTSPDYILRMPAKDGTLALTSDIPTVEANPTASGTTTLTKLKVGSTVYTLPSGGGGTAGVSSLGGQTGAITLGDGLSMSNNQLVPKIKNIYLDSSDYLCIETN